MSIRSLGIASALFAFGCLGNQTGSQTDPGTGNSGGKGTQASASFSVTPLVSDLDVLAPRVDADLVNAWGIVVYDEAFWIADNGTGKVSAYDGAGAAVQGSGALIGDGITGIAVNETDKFLVRSGTT